MPKITHIIRAEIDPLQPVPEICAIISAVLPYHPDQEEAILRGVSEAIERRLNELKGDEQKDAKPLRESGRGK